MGACWADGRACLTALTAREVTITPLHLEFWQDPRKVKLVLLGAGASVAKRDPPYALRPDWFLHLVRYLAGAHHDGALRRSAGGQIYEVPDFCPWPSLRLIQATALPTSCSPIASSALWLRLPCSSTLRILRVAPLSLGEATAASLFAPLLRCTPTRRSRLVMSSPLGANTRRSSTSRSRPRRWASAAR